MLSSWGGLWSDAADFLLRDAVGVGGGCEDVVGGGLSLLLMGLLADWRLCERVTLDDMRFRL